MRVTLFILIILNHFQLNERFLQRVKNKYGEKAVKNIKNMTEIKLQRKIIEEAKLNT